MAGEHYKFVGIPASGTANDMLKAINESPVVRDLRATGHRSIGMVGQSDDGSEVIFGYEAPSRGDFLYLVFEVPLIIFGVFMVLAISGVIQ